MLSMLWLRFSVGGIGNTMLMRQVWKTLTNIGKWCAWQSEYGISRKQDSWRWFLAESSELRGASLQSTGIVKEGKPNDSFLSSFADTPEGGSSSMSLRDGFGISCSVPATLSGSLRVCPEPQGKLRAQNLQSDGCHKNGAKDLAPLS